MQIHSRNGNEATVSATTGDVIHGIVPTTNEKPVFNQTNIPTLKLDGSSETKADLRQRVEDAKSFE